MITKIKPFNVRLKYEDWLFIKQESALNEISMNEFIALCLSKYKKDWSKRLTSSDTVVS